MLTIYGKKYGNRGFCDSIARRDFIKIGGMAMGGLSLGQMLQADAQAANGSNHRAVINIYMPGGPSHIDLWDLKPNAPAEIRGDFRPIKTNVPGIEICELFPRMASMMDKFIPVRSICDADGRHDAYQCMTGWKRGQRQPRAGRPNWGSWASQLQGKVNNAVPPNVSLMYPTGNGTWGEVGDGGFLGVKHSPFGLVEKDPTKASANMVLRGITLNRLGDRESLRSAFDNFRRETDNSGIAESMDVYHQQALGILTTSSLVEALDLSREDPKVLERYGQNDTAYQRDGAPKMVRNFCIARRLVEAGARVVSLNYSRWDWHGGDGMNFPRSRQEFPLLDQGMSALITDLHERGLDKHVSVVLWGEFGRTPKINKNNSRDHWPRVSCAMLAGGGMKAGQVIGSTNKHGEHAVDRPVKFQEVFATLYKNLGIDSGKVRFFDKTGTPQYMVEPGIEPMRELI